MFILPPERTVRRSINHHIDQDIGCASAFGVKHSDGMPVSKRRSSPIGFNRNPPQMNGLYVHSSPPKVLQMHSSVIRQWLRSGDIKQLEKLILEGQGYKLVGEYSPDPKVRSLLKQIPAFLIKSKKLHHSVAKGDLKQLKKLLFSIKPQESLMKNVHLSKTQGGLGLLHKAVYYGHTHVVEFLASSYPETIKMKDNDGKTPLHYCGASREAGRIWPILIKSGADPSTLDSKGKLPTYYMERSNEIQLPEEKILSGISVSSTNDKNSIVIKPSNIRIWIHDKDIRKLQKVIWEGHGAKLRTETSKHPKVKRFLDGVPYILNIIKDVHSSVVNGDWEEFQQKTSDPIPVEILGSKDTNGLTPLHKAAGLNRRKIAENILKRNPNSVFSIDQEGKTPLHYAALVKDDNEIYTLLTGNYADETAVDNNGKTPPYYKANPKEISTKVLEVIPDAPRTAVTFPQSFDWSLYHPEGAAILGNSIPSRNSLAKIAENNNTHNSETNNESEVETIPQETTAETTSETIPETNSKQPEEDKNSVTESENLIQEESQIREENKTFDIWTNDEEKQDDEEEEEYEEEGEDKNIEEITPQEDTPKESSVPPTPEEIREKTEREIAEERQRLLDEGLIRISSQEDEDAELMEIIETGDMEKLAAMVLNGEGDKLKGKTSSNPEVQSFLDNTPAYMSKITAVHEAARNGSLKDLQGALDRRKFAIAKDSSDKLGTTPLHAAVICENIPVVKYLGGRFPETLLTKDKFGRTPLHYAAVLSDDQIYNELVELGADPNAVDDEGHNPSFYKTSQQLTQENILELMGLPGVEVKPKLNNQVSSPVTDPSIHNIEPEISFDEGVPLSKKAGSEDPEDDNDSQQSSFSLTDRDEYGQSVLHFAAARAHGRGGLFQLIHESGVNLGYRDELYRTARDIAQQANIPENINEIDKYVISLAAKGETGKLVELFLEGYDHILDVEDDEDNSILTIATNKNHEKAIAFLKAIPSLEEKREKIQRAARAGDGKQIEQIISQSKNSRFLIIGKNSYGRCSLHISVLCQQKEVTELIAQKFPETLRIGDNLERTPLHYAMGVEEVETLSKILIKCGAKRVVKDLKGRQPTYYFMNKTEILKLQEEENALKV